jgi:hypothetical protein
MKSAGFEAAGIIDKIDANARQSDDAAAASAQRKIPAAARRGRRSQTALGVACCDAAIWRDFDLNSRQLDG